MITVVVVACGVGLAVMVPTWNRMRVAAKCDTCLANLKKIGSAVDLYAYSNYGVFPEGFGRLMVAQQLPPDSLVCPDGTETPAAGATPQAQADDLAKGRHASYFYTGKGLNKRSGAGAGSAAVVAYEPLSHHGDGAHVLLLRRARRLRAPSPGETVDRRPPGGEEPARRDRLLKAKPTDGRPWAFAS